MNRPATKYFSVRPRKQSWWHALWVTNNEAFASPFLKHRPEGGSKHLQRQLQSFLHYTYQLLAGFFYAIIEFYATIEYRPIYFKLQKSQIENESSYSKDTFLERSQL